MSKRKKNLGILLFILLIYLSLSFLLYSLEKGHQDANITSFPDVIWYVFVTLTTVGYGDYYPVTTIGKVIGLIFIFSSLGLVGFVFGKLTEQLLEFRERRKMGLHGTDFKNHIIIIGWDQFTASITKQLVNAENKVAIITDDKNHIDLIYQQFSDDMVFAIFSDLNDINMLKKANASNAFLTVVNLKDDTDNLILILNIKQEFSDMNFLVTLDNSELKETFESAGVTYVLSRNEISSKLIASYIFEPDVANFTNDLLTSAKKAEEFDIQQFKVVEENPYINTSYNKAFTDLKSRFNVLLIGIAKYKNGHHNLHKLPTDDIAIAKGDYLIVILNGKKETTIADFFHTKEGITR